MYSASRSPFSRGPGAVKLSRYHTGPLLPGRLRAQSSGKLTSGAGTSKGKFALSAAADWAERMSKLCAQVDDAAGHNRKSHISACHHRREPMLARPRPMGQAAG